MVTWDDVIADEKRKPYFTALIDKVSEARGAGVTVFPPESDTFNALAMTALRDVNVVILGQDPYHGEGQAHGLCFSVLPGVKTPPSLANIYKTLAEDIDGFIVPDHGSLTSWAQQGVLLLNTVLTVEKGVPNSHAKWGWDTFTDAIIEAVNTHCEHVVFLLWGTHAQKKGEHVNREKHLVLHAPHPSPLSAYRGFFECKHFSKANYYLTNNGKTPINWQV